MFRKSHGDSSIYIKKPNFDCSECKLCFDIYLIFGLKYPKFYSCIYWNFYWMHFFIVTASCLPRGNMATEHVKLNMVNWTWPILSWKREGNGVHMCYGCIRVHRALEKHPRKHYLLKFLLNAFFYSFIPFIQCKLLMQCKSPNAWQNQSFSFFSVFFSAMLNIRSILFFMADRDTRPALKWTLKMGQFTMLSPIWEFGQLVLGSDMEDNFEAVQPEPIVYSPSRYQKKTIPHQMQVNGT